jgi:hypothetical protein
VEKYGTARQATDGNIIRRMRFACWITKAIDTHSEYVILTAFQREQWLRERASMLRYKYIVCLVLFCVCVCVQKTLGCHSMHLETRVCKLSYLDFVSYRTRPTLLASLAMDFVICNVLTLMDVKACSVHLCCHQVGRIGNFPAATRLRLILRPLVRLRNDHKMGCYQ